MRIKNFLLLAAAVMVLAGSFFLPNTVAGITDARRLDNYVTVDSQSVSFERAPELALPERIALVASPNTEKLALKTGQAMDYESACKKAAGELERFFNDGPFKFDFGRLAVEECGAAFVIDSGNPSVNLIVWELVISDSFGNTVTMSLDDETGSILKLIYWWESSENIYAGGLDNAISSIQADKAFNTTAIRISEMMASYYGLPVELADYQFSGSLAYYRADMLGGGEVISMFGVVRATSFTMNEKLLY